jgi:hypothetical protein
VYLGDYDPDRAGDTVTLSEKDGGRTVTYDENGFARTDESISDSYTGIHTPEEESGLWSRNALTESELDTPLGRDELWTSRTLHSEQYIVFDGQPKVVWSGYQTLAMSDTIAMDILPADLSDGTSAEDLYKRMEDSFYTVDFDSGTNTLVLTGNDGTSFSYTLSNAEIATLTAEGTLSLQAGGHNVRLSGGNSPDGVLTIHGAWNIERGDWVARYIDLCEKGYYVNDNGEKVFVKALHTTDGILRYSASDYEGSEPPFDFMEMKADFETVEIHRNKLTVETGYTDHKRDIWGDLKDAERSVPLTWSFDLGEGRSQVCARR